MNKLSSLLNWLGNTIGANPSTLATTSKTLVGAINEIEPVGSIKMYAGANAPSGWLKCDGSAVSRTTYAALFTAIGTTYGAGNGSTTFNLPNLTDRMPIGAGNLYSLGAKGGSKDAIVPYHRHSIAAVNTGGMSANATHTHTAKNGGSFLQNGTGDWNAQIAGGTFFMGGYTCAPASVAHTHQVPAHNSDYVGTSGNVTNANLPPYTAINYIIFAGV